MIKLYEHNNLVYLQSKKMLDDKNRVAIIQATGTGKSYITANLLEKYDKILLISSTNYILNQYREILSNNRGIEYLTYQGLLFKNFVKNEYNIIVFDELHRYGATEWEKACNTLLEYNRDAKLIGTTATPLRQFQNNRDVTIELFQESTICGVSLDEAISMGILPKPKYIKVLFDIKNELKSSYREKIQKANKISIKEKERLNKKVDISMLNWNNAYGLTKILKKHIKKDMKKFIVFCNNIEECSCIKEKLMISMNEINNNWIVLEINNDSMQKENETALATFNESKEHTIIFAVNMLNEGIHIDDVDGAFMFRKTSSIRLFYQQLGRVLSSKGKNPLVFDMVNNSEVLYTDISQSYGTGGSGTFNEGENKNIKIDSIFEIYDYTHDLMLDLQAIDNIFDSFNIYINELISFKESKGHVNVPLNYANGLGRWCNRMRQLYNNNLLDEVRINKLNSIGFIWDVHKYLFFKNLEKFICEINNNGKVNHERGNKKNPLYTWYTRCRQLYNKDELEQYKIDAFKEHNIELDFLHPIEKFEEDIAVLTRYKEKNGHMSISSRDKKSYKSLKRIKSMLKRGKLAYLDIERLTKLGVILDRKDYHFEKRIDELRGFKQKHGHCVIEAVSDVDSEFKSWCSYIRNSRGEDSDNPLSSEQYKTLNEIGFCWDYNKGLFDLQIKRYLDTVGIYEKEKNNPLWNWISSIRHNYNKGTLDDWKLEKLLSIGFVFNVKDKYFDDMLVELLKYHKQNKTYHIKPSHSKLARWATSLKANYEKGTISEYRSKKLIEIGFVNEMCKK